MHIDLLFPSLYLKTGDLRGKDVDLTIVSVTVEELKMKGGRKENKPLVYFEETAKSAKRYNRDEKRLVMNKTNALVIAKLHGKETDKWIGQKITLYPTTTRFGREEVECIRVREVAPAGKDRDQEPVQTTRLPEPSDDLLDAL